MARVEANAEVADDRLLRLRGRDAGDLGHAPVRGSREQMALKEIDGLVDRLEEALRLGLDGERDGLPGGLAESVEVGRMAEHAIGHARDVLLAAHLGPKRHRARC